MTIILDVKAALTNLMLSLQNFQEDYAEDFSTSSPESPNSSLEVDLDSATSLEGSMTNDFEAFGLETHPSDIFNITPSSPVVEYEFEQEISNLNMNKLDLEAFGVTTGKLREVRKGDSFLDMDVDDGEEAEYMILPDPDILDLSDALFMPRPKSRPSSIEVVFPDNEAELQLTLERVVAFGVQVLTSSEDLGGEDQRPVDMPYEG